MEVVSTTLQPSTLSVALETDAIQRELDDRSFDTGDYDEIDLQEAFNSASTSQLRDFSNDSDTYDDTEVQYDEQTEEGRQMRWLIEMQEDVNTYTQTEAWRIMEDLEEMGNTYFCAAPSIQLVVLNSAAI